MKGCGQDSMGGWVRRSGSFAVALKSRSGPPRKAGPTKARKAYSQEWLCHGIGGKPRGWVGASQGAETSELDGGAKFEGTCPLVQGILGGAGPPAKVAPNHPGAAARSQTSQCEVRIEATTASSLECVCAGVDQPIECPDFTQEEKSK